ncbi:hypothetical protein KWI08_15485 [Morganella morganii]|uniref:hypothetical protein n=1 Tax=Morganella morganii TaxID=582 RepID=UPI0021D0B156|nr:hypothetical protein [Morganella morganii]MCU6275295.1 hypothetical protein [Morganella morganii]
MTTIISKETVFSATDERWTDQFDRPAQPPFKKFYVFNDSILFFSGDINPILATLASYLTSALGVDEEYAERMAEISEIDNDKCEIIEVDRTDGRVVYSQNASVSEENGHIFYGAGSGSARAIQSFITGIRVINESGNHYQFIKHGLHLLTQSMKYAFKADKCSGGNIAKIIWYGDGIIDNQLNWIKPSEINNYHDSIIKKIAERFESKNALTELITMMIDEEKQYAKELEFKSKVFDDNSAPRYSAKNNQAAKGRYSMNQTANATPGVAVKTSGSSEGKVFSAASLKARLAQRKAEGRS